MAILRKNICLDTAREDGAGDAMVLLVATKIPYSFSNVALMIIPHPAKDTV